MKLYKALITSLATFSRIPLPMVELDSEDCKYSLCFFPLVGVILALLEGAAYYICIALGIGTVLRAALMTVLPLLVTGGMHMDGFCDTSDAFNSFQPKERKLEILKDPHIGAFGVIRMLMYMTVMFGLMSEIKNVVLLGGVFVFSRAITAWTVVRFPSAKDKGMGASEQKTAQKSAVERSSVVWIAVGMICLIGFGGLLEAVDGVFLSAVVISILMLVVALLWCLRYKTVILKQLGGFTGDTSGWHLMISELCMMGVIVLVSRLFAMGW